MTRLVIAGGRIVDQAGERAGDVVVEAGRVVAVTGGVARADGDIVLDARG